MSEEKKIGGRAFGETLNAEKFIEEQIALIREQVGGGKVLLALSGGVDSSVVAALLLRAIGDQLCCVHVNHGLMRKGESEQVIKVFREELGANLTYVDATDRFLDKLAGVAEPERKRKIIGEEFIGDDACAMILGYKIFYGNGLGNMLKSAAKRAEEGRASVFGFYVNDPERFCVVEFDENYKALSLEEKPKNPKSNYAVTGLYFYPSGVSEMAKQVKPSARGELEITTLNQMYLEKGLLDCDIMGRGFSWLDTGTMDSLMQAAGFIQTIQNMQGIIVASPEEIAYRYRMIDKEQLLNAAGKYGKSPYGHHLRMVAEGRMPR